MFAKSITLLLNFQLCINAANEQLHFYFNQFIFCWEREEYILEGIPVSLDEVQSNREVLETLLARCQTLFLRPVLQKVRLYNKLRQFSLLEKRSSFLCFFWFENFNLL